jgi:hypothetical protein
MAWAVGWSWAGRIATGLECLREDRVEVGLLGPGIPGNSSSDGEGGSKSTATRHVHQAGKCTALRRRSCNHASHPELPRQPGLGVARLKSRGSKATRNETHTLIFYKIHMSLQSFPSVKLTYRPNASLSTPSYYIRWWRLFSCADAYSPHFFSGASSC